MRLGDTLVGFTGDVDLLTLGELDEVDGLGRGVAYGCTRQLPAAGVGRRVRLTLANGLSEALASRRPLLFRQWLLGLVLGHVGVDMTTLSSCEKSAGAYSQLRERRDDPL